MIDSSIKAFTLIFGGILAMLTGCLDVEEDIWLEKDGSGKYQVSIDMKELFQVSNFFITDDSLKMSEEELVKKADSVIMREKTLKQLDSIILVINAVDGIKNGNYSKDSGIIYIRFDFVNIASLNQAYSKARRLYNITFLPDYEFLKQSKILERRIKREYYEGKVMEDKHIGKVINKLSPVFLARGDYQTNYHLPGKAKKVNNERAKWSDDKKTISLHSSLNRLLKDPSRMEVIIKHKGR